MKKLIYFAAFALAIAGCKKDSDDAVTPPPADDEYATPKSHATGVPALTGMLDASKFTQSSIIQADLNTNIGRVPLYKGTYKFGSTGALSATLERGTFVPGMAGIPFPNDDLDLDGARSSIFALTNGKLGLDMPESEGLSHVLLDNAPGNISLQNPALLETLRKLGDSHNVLGSFPTLTNQAERELYSPLWDLTLADWSEAVVAARTNFAQTDANTLRQLAAHGLITNPGGMPLSSANFIGNCPVLGFATTAPTAAQAPRP